MSPIARCLTILLALSATRAFHQSFDSDGILKRNIPGRAPETLSNPDSFPEAHSFLPKTPEARSPSRVVSKKVNISPAETLTSVVSKFVSGLEVLEDLMSGIKLVASFFKTTYTTSTNEHYWEELSEAAEAMVNEAIDDTIIQQTDDAVERLSENIQIYVDANTTEGDFSALQLTLIMDNQLNGIMSLYAGTNHVERVAMHYLDMATTRLSLWQATTLRYIDEYTINGEIPSGNPVCDIVLKWDLAFSTETTEIISKLKPALATWNYNYTNQLSMSCQVTEEHPAFKEWRRQANCKIFDGYHGIEAESWHNRCHHKSDPKCPALEFICFNYCNYNKLYPHITENTNNYDILNDLVDTMSANFLVIQKSQLDKCKKQCGL